MSRIYDNWERLVAAVLKREEIWQLCHEHSRSPSICSESSDFSPSFRSPLDDNNFKSPDLEWIEQYEPGVYFNLVALQGGTRDLKRVRFSRKRFNADQAEAWWSENREKVYERYNIQFGIPRTRGSSVSGQAAR
ncbi:hypothetical protein Pfo_014708 [Paulownia fortunei]|nr:hypothetical protein Pfo_014708 [Paulownia fortunei]